MPRRLLPIGFAALTFVVGGAFASSAWADGLPVLGVDVGLRGVTTPTSPDRYVTVGAGANTVVERIQRNGGRVLAMTTLPGTFTVPAVAYDDSAGGLSADGRTLVLIRPRVQYPQQRTKLAILDARRLRVQRIVTLRGDFSFDAVSPTGSTMYLIQYTSPGDPTAYRVRAYDLHAARLLPQPVVDPKERGEAMRGSPISRATSADGRWAYTLYDGAGMEPFVHALDTVRRTARCIDLDALAGRRDIGRLRLHLGADGGTLSVQRGTRTVAAVDVRAFRAVDPGAGSADSSGFPGTLVAAASGAALAAAALAFVVLRRRRPALT